MRSFILEILVTVGLGSIVMGCGGGTEIHSLGNLPTPGSVDTSSSISTSSGGAGNDTTTASSGSAGAPGLPDCSEAPDDRCQLVAGHDIRALAADRTHLYWVEYGTEDELGNPRYDGKLMAQAFDGGPPELVRGDLASPVGLALSESYFYVHLERWQDSHGAETKSLVRLSRAGGAAELVQANLSPYDPADTRCHYPCFAATRNHSYFYHRQGVHRVSEQPGATASELWDEASASGFVASSPDDTVYFNIQPGGFYQLLFQAEEPERLMKTTVSGMQWDPDGLYWLEGDEDGGGYLVRWQLDNGPPQRLAEVTRIDGDYVGGSLGPLKVVDGDYFVLSDRWDEVGDRTSTIVSGSLAEPERVTTRVEFGYFFDSGRYFAERWVGTREAIYWLEEGAILRAP